MNRFQVLFSMCTIAVSLYAMPVQAGGGHNNNFNNNHNFKKNFNHQQFGNQFFFPPTKFNGGNFNHRNFNGNNFNSFNFGPKHKQVNPFFVPTFQNQGFNNGHNFVPPHQFKHNHNNFNHFSH